ncbi:MAG TPA: acyl-CoA thioesterase [Gemmatimonadales bacterium]|nr:acyl-CoA thioesterase [Gemmatimonadales bacterium]
MNLLGRLVLVVLRILGYRRGGFPPLGEATLRFTVLPHDLDFNLHLNNARYLSFMDLGRVDLLNRLGLLRLAFRGRWMPALGAMSIRYYRPLFLFNRVTVTTRVAAWDEKWFYLEQRFERGGRPIATAFAKGLVRGPGGNIPTPSVLREAGVTMASPPLPPEALRLPE